MQKSLAQHPFLWTPSPYGRTYSLIRKPVSGVHGSNQLFLRLSQIYLPAAAVAAAAAAAKSLQSCPTLYDPIDGRPPGSPVPGILQARTLEWVAISFSNAWKWKVKVKLLSCDPTDCSPPGSSIHGIFQARVLEWGAIAFSLQLGRATLFYLFYCILVLLDKTWCKGREKNTSLCVPAT